MKDMCFHTSLPSRSDVLLQTLCPLATWIISQIINNDPKELIQSLLTMSFWTTVMSTPDVEVSLFTGIDQFQSANVSRMTSTTSMADVVTNDHSIDIDMLEADDNSAVHVAKAPITTADTSAAVDEDVDMANAQLPSTTHITDAVEPVIHLQVPRFANLGLNARPLKFVGWKEP